MGSKRRKGGLLTKQTLAWFTVNASNVRGSELPYKGGLILFPLENKMEIALFFFHLYFNCMAIIQVIQDFTSEKRLEKCRVFRDLGFGGFRIGCPLADVIKDKEEYGYVTNTI